MQIQARASRGVKSRRVGSGSNFHETFPRMNESRRVERLRVLGEPTSSTLLFSSLLLRDFPLSSPLIPPPSAERRRPRPPFCAFFSCLSIVAFSRMHAQRFSRRNSWPRYPTILHLALVWFPGTAKRFFRNFRNILRGVSLLPGRWKSSVVKHKCNSTVDYTRKIALDGPSNDVSTECMHSKCIGSRTHISFLRAGLSERMTDDIIAKKSDVLPFSIITDMWT